MALFSQCFEGMGPARLGAWLEAGGGKFNREVDLRALQLLRSLALREVEKMRPLQETTAAARAVAGRSDPPAVQLALAVRYVDRCERQPCPLFFFSPSPFPAVSLSRACLGKLLFSSMCKMKNGTVCGQAEGAAARGGGLVRCGT